MSSTEQTETISNTAALDTSPDVATATIDENSTNGVEEDVSTAETKTGKRKRSTKKAVDTEEDRANISNGRPKRTVSKREEVPSGMATGTSKTDKNKAPRESVEQPGGGDDNDDDDEPDHDKNLPIVHDVADAVWVKMGGHPWWPSLVIRDPNDSTQNFTKISGNARPKRMYFVVFYGSTADFAWVSDNFIIPYQGVEAFTKYAQESVDKASGKHQKEQLTERFQLKVSISRRDDWELAVREADDALKHTNEMRLQEIEPKVQFYTAKLVTPKGQSGRRPKASNTKPKESFTPNETSTLNATDRSLLAEKTFEFKSEDENENESSTVTPLRKPSIVKIKKQTSNGTDLSTTPSAKRRPIRNSVQSEETPIKTVFAQTANGSSVSYQQRATAAAAAAAAAPVITTTTPETPTKSNGTNIANGASSGKKRGRPSLKQPPASSSSDHSPTPEFNSASPTVTTKFTTQRKLIIKSLSLNHNNDGKHDIRTGFLSATDEQEVLDALEKLRSTKTFEDAEQEAKRRFEHILCLSLNRTHVDVPQEWFYTFLFSHPSLIINNPQWFTETTESDMLNDEDFLNDVQSSSSLAVLKHQLVVLSKLYRNELQTRQSAPVKKRRSTGGKKHEIDAATNDNQQEELVN